MITALLAAFQVANYGVEREHAKGTPQKKEEDALRQIRSEVSKTYSLLEKTVSEQNDPDKLKVFLDVLNDIRDTASITAQTAGNTLQSSEQTRKLLLSAIGKGVANGSQGSDR